jgi:flavin reductase (DIM6/NTAB) family NADH-FMN oxidoreductase RutF
MDPAAMAARLTPAGGARAPASEADFRRAMRRWGSGVTVITVGEVGRVFHGLTVSAFTSVSLDPPTILACINADSRAHALLRDRPWFAVNVLSSSQRDVSDYFASARAESDPGRFASRAGRVHPCAVLEHALAVLECSVVGACAVGDHSIYLGRVDAAETSDREPLLYVDGAYR